MMAAQRPPRLEVSPPLLNSANPWATTLEDLTALYECPHTGAVTTRTSLVAGFPHDPSIHQFTLFDTAAHKSQQDRTKLLGPENASLNNLGYSPIVLETYLEFIRTISTLPSSRSDKGFVVSVTGSPEDVVECYKLIAHAQTSVKFPLAMEINLSCPNIPGKPPPAYNGDSLLKYLNELEKVISDSDLPRIAFGLKTPPYTYSKQFEELISALERTCKGDRVCPVSFITATNTLGSCLVLADGDNSEPALPGTGIGGMAGAPLHPLALGNVRTIRKMLDESKYALRHVQIIGVGGVLDAAGFKRMNGVGADIIGVGTGLGIKGVNIFRDIADDLK